MPGPATKGAITKARAVRAEHGLGLDRPLPDLLSLVEDGCGVRVVILQDLGDDLAGAYIPLAGKPPVIFLNGSDIAARMRFTLAHELGHHVFRDSRSVDTRDALLQQGHWREVRANAFAAELLMPGPAVAALGVDPTLDGVVALACAFGTSLYASALRLATAGIATWPRFDELKAAIAADDGALSARCRYEDGLSEARRHLPRYPPGSVLAKLQSGVAAGEEQRV